MMRRYPCTPRRSWAISTPGPNSYLCTQAHSALHTQQPTRHEEHQTPWVSMTSATDCTPYTQQPNQPGISERHPKSVIPSAAKKASRHPKPVCPQQPKRHMQ
eukprot:1154436-Pelagomonas_calceolata.AAC.2